MYTLTDMLGAVAGTLTTAAFVPQVLKTWRTRSVRDISLVMFVLFSVGLSCWVVYGILLNSWPIIMTNAATLGLALVILYLKLRVE